MAPLRFPARLVLAALLIGSTLWGADAMPAAVPSGPRPVVNAADDCYAIGQQVAAENGGTLGGASASEQAGQQVCVIVVVIPPREGKRGRRIEVVVPHQ